jgi:hypothetical protein
MGRPPGSKNKSTKGKTDTKPEETTQAVPGEVRPAISAPKLAKLMKAKRAAKKDTAEISGGLGNLIAAAIENDHLHRLAFNMICRLDTMENEKIADFLDAFGHYLDISGIEKRADSVMRMDLGKPGDGEEEAEEEETDEPTNVHGFPAAAGRA